VIDKTRDEAVLTNDLDAKAGISYFGWTEDHCYIPASAAIVACRKIC